MKSLSSGVRHRNGKTFAIRKAALAFCSIIVLSLLFTACQKETAAETVIEEVQGSANNDGNILDGYTGLAPQTMWELQQARASTARYRQLKNAIKDGYEDIDVVVQGMGHHFMKKSIVDGTFDYRNPEILVYNKNHDGEMELVAVEYAVPIPITPNLAPAGFTGNNDVWDRNTGFNLYLLHAWVWTFNPSGVFNPTNPSVHVH